MLYYFSIGTIFKNESHIMKEWLEHYFFHGIEHIYMINDRNDPLPRRGCATDHAGLPRARRRSSEDQCREPLDAFPDRPSR